MPEEDARLSEFLDGGDDGGPETEATGDRTGDGDDDPIAGGTAPARGDETTPEPGPPGGSERERDLEADAEADAGERPAPAPATVTYRWAPDGAACPACGATVEELWVDGAGNGEDDSEAAVCAACKEW